MLPSSIQKQNDEIQDEYTGPLLKVQRDSLNRILSAVKQPEKPAGYTGTSEDWQKVWQESLSLALSTSMRHFEDAIPPNTPDPIKMTLRTVKDYMSPWRIDQFNLNGTLVQRPTIGDVYDYVIQYFKEMLTDRTLSDALIQAKISRLFYDKIVGTLTSGGELVFTGFGDAQRDNIQSLWKDIDKYEAHTRNTKTTVPFQVLEMSGHSINSLEYIMRLLTDDSSVVSADTLAMNDCYSIASTARSSDMTVFNKIYQNYRALARTELQTRIESLKTHKNNLLTTADPVTYIRKLAPQLVKPLILSLPQDALHRLCKVPGFATMDNLEYITQTIPLHELNISPLDLITTASNLLTLLRYSDDASNPSLITSIGPERLKTIMSEGSGLGLLTQFNVNLSSLIITTLGEAGLISCIVRGGSLETSLREVPDQLKKEIITTLGRNGLKSTIKRGFGLGSILNALTEPLWPILLDILKPEDLEIIISDGMEVCQLLSRIRSTSKTQLLTALGPHLIRKTLNESIYLDLVVSNVPEVTQPVLEMLSDLLPSIINNSTSKHKEEMLSNKAINRAYKYYSGHYNNYDAREISAASPSAMADFFDEITPQNNSTSIYGTRSSAQQIAHKCRQVPTPGREALLSYLREQLRNIDTTEPSQYTRESIPQPDGELAMRIMHCIDKLNRSLRADLTVANTNTNKMTIS